MKRLSSFLIFIGILSFLFSVVLFVQRISPSRLSFDVEFSKPVYAKKIVKPVKRIIIPRININLPVVGSEIKKGEWETTTKGISYLKASPVPGEVGNSILYGHNFDELLGKLPDLTPGDTIEIEYDDHSKKEFIIQSTQEVTPKQVDIIKPTTDTRITLYTCSGFMDSKRFVVVAIPKA